MRVTATRGSKKEFIKNKRETLRSIHASRMCGHAIIDALAVSVKRCIAINNVNLAVLSVEGLLLREGSDSKFFKKAASCDGMRLLYGVLYINRYSLY